ncbi:hypothetical protein BaRGS_00031579, partial [Batillaria attramentaria]
LPPSPYLQRLPHANLYYGKMARRRPRSSRRRPMSASTASQSGMSSKPKIDAKFIADSNLWDPATPRAEAQPRKQRPASAPIRRARPFSGASYTSNGQRSRPGSAYKSVFKRQPHTIKVYAFKNGTRDTFVHIAAPNLKILLEFATDKLGLAFAARRIFLEDGVEVFDAADIPPDADVYISMGENYKDPFGNTKKNMIVRQGAKWSLNGIILPEERKKRSRLRMSKRLRSLAQNNYMRIIIYRNGKWSEPREIVVDPSKFDEFLQSCTGSLDLRNYAKKAFDWEGNEITDLEDTPVLDDCLQQNTSQVRGPLWISAGEGFSPLGTKEFLLNIKQVLREKLKRVKFYQKEIDAALNEEYDKVTLASVKSMKSEELYEASEKVETEITQLKEALKRVDGKLEAIKDEAEKEEEKGSVYRMSHIKEVSANDRLVGRKGLKLRVYENGMQDGEFVFYFNLREAQRGVESKERLLERLLDELSCSQRASNAEQPRLTAVAQKIFDKFGHEIKDVMTLVKEEEDDDDPEVWVSYGEPFISPFTYCLELIVDKATRFTSEEGVDHIFREQLMDPGHVELTKDPGNWEASIGFPALYDSPEDDMLKNDPDKVNSMKEHAEVDKRGAFLLLKDKNNLALYPELTINEKPRRGHQDAHIWVISKSGYISSKAMPQLCFTVSDSRVEARLFTSGTPIEGFMVTVQKKMAGNPNQIWTFSPDGTISSEAYPQLALTYLGNKHGDEESYSSNTPQGVPPGTRVYFIMADPLGKKDASCQRFGLKQERFDNLGQWKYTDAPNTEWNKLALSWPVKQDGTLNEKYDWPMEGFFMPSVPPLQRSHKKGAGFSVLPVRLLVLKNGERDGPVPVVGPNLTTMMKQEGCREKPEKSRKNRPKETTDGECSIQDDLNMHCMDFTIRELELTMFLDSCTALLNLPFAARRIFDEDGVEHFTLQSLKRDQVVYVSCGEPWSDPQLTREEQRRRLLLSQLSSDVSKMRQYCALQNPENFVVEVEGALVPNARLVVNKQWRHGEDEDTGPDSRADLESEMQQQSVGQQDEEETEDSAGRTAHERAHLLSEQRANALKWPWERVMNVSHSLDGTDMEAQMYSDPELYEKFKPRLSPRVSRDTLQQFVYEDGFIACAANRNLVLGATTQEGRVSEVLLVKRQPDDISQRWAMLGNGEIRSRISQKQVLTVSLPNGIEGRGENARPLSFVGCPITLQSRRANQFGHAHQRWHYDAETGLISAFSADVHDKEITAANKADVCTYAISGAVEIDQPGYEAEVPSRRHGNLKLKVCVSCARAMRGRHKLQALPPNTPFSCAMGIAKSLKIPQVGSFRVLNGKVDLSTHEAEITLQSWENQLEVLRKESSTSAIASEINAARTVTTVKVMAYKNGEGRMRPGEIICGSTVEGQCTQRLGLNTSARRLYAEDGTMFLDIDDIVAWAVSAYRSALADKLEAMLLSDGDQPPSDNREQEERMEQLEQSATQGVDAIVSQALANVQLFGEEGEDSSRGQVDSRAGEEGDERAQAETTPRLLEESKVDTVEANKIAKRREQLLSRVELPPLDAILRYPIEVWVSSGKNFVPPEVVESKEENRRKKHALKSQVCQELDIEKHVLRQMKGRRFRDQSPGAYRSTLSSRQPVVIEGHWQDSTVEERVKHQSVSKLQTHLGEIQANQKGDKSQVVGVNLSGALYKQPVVKRVNVFVNGESPEHAVTVWGETLSQLLENATLKLGLWKTAKRFYTTEGKLIETIDDINSEQLLCVSTGKTFTQSQSQRTTVEVRANWGRARKQYGPQATDIGVTVNKNPKVDVDPFGPPELALPLTDGQERNQTSTA